MAWNLRGERHSWDRSRWLFLRGLAIVCAIAFLSFWIQLEGLVGSDGIAPAQRTMDQFRFGLGASAWWTRPSLLLLGASDWVLHTFCAIGLAAAVLLFFDVAPAVCLFLVWLLYLSITWACGPFLLFQWDTLLIETCLVSVFYAPWRWGRPTRPDPDPSRIGRWLLWWLAFRLFFESGVVKLTWNDPTWWDATALTYHYWTQPLPNVLSWYAHQLPDWMHRVSTVATLVVEIGAPLALVTIRPARLAACGLLLGLQGLIFATGNYGFFNLLAALLCVPFLDDRVLGRLRFRPPAVPGSLPRLVATWAFALPVGLLGSFQIADLFVERQPSAIERATAPFLSVNGYGLFRVMTTRRPELLIQGRHAGGEWLDYDFRFKPDAPEEPPRWVQPHMPRLDWRLWFEALAWERSLSISSRVHPSAWFRAFLDRLLLGSPSVLGLLAGNPFDGEPPAELRVLLYHYRFATPEERSSDGRWWARTRLHVYTHQ